MGPRMPVALAALMLSSAMLDAEEPFGTPYGVSKVRSRARSKANPEPSPLFSAKKRECKADKRHRKAVKQSRKRNRP